MPTGYKLNSLLDLWNGYDNVINNNKYANNYDFYKAVFLVNRDKFIDTGYLLLKEDNSISSPVSVLYYEYYDSKTELEAGIEKHKNSIQCVVSKSAVPFGKSQNPRLWDYADGVDTIKFLALLI